MTNNTCLLHTFMTQYFIFITVYMLGKMIPIYNTAAFQMTNSLAIATV